MAKQYHIRAGSLRHVLEIQANYISKDAMNQDIKTWRTIGKRWGSITPTNASEKSNSDQIRGIISHIIKIRFFKDLTPDLRLKHRNRIFSFDGIRDIDEREKTQILNCTEMAQTNPGL